jgi:hypothetical protein
MQELRDLAETALLQKAFVIGETGFDQAQIVCQRITAKDL